MRQAFRPMMNHFELVNSDWTYRNPFEAMQPGAWVWSVVRAKNIDRVLWPGLRRHTKASPERP